MAFANNAEFEDDFRKVGPDATAEFAPGESRNPTEHRQQRQPGRRR